MQVEISELSSRARRVAQHRVDCILPFLQHDVCSSAKSINSGSTRRMHCQYQSVEIGILAPKMKSLLLRYLLRQQTRNANLAVSAPYMQESIQRQSWELFLTLRLAQNSSTLRGMLMFILQNYALCTIMETSANCTLCTALGDSAGASLTTRR
jgi:hypothetical protein